AVVASLAGSARSSAKDTPTTPIYTLSLHDALPIYRCAPPTDGHAPCGATHPAGHVPGIPSAHRVAPSALRGGRHPAPSLPALPAGADALHPVAPARWPPAPPPQPAPRRAGAGAGPTARPWSAGRTTGPSAHPGGGLHPGCGGAPVRAALPGSVVRHAAAAVARPVLPVQRRVHPARPAGLPAPGHAPGHRTPPRRRGAPGGNAGRPSSRRG